MELKDRVLNIIEHPYFSKEEVTFLFERLMGMGEEVLADRLPMFEAQSRGSVVKVRINQLKILVDKGFKK